MPTSWKSVVQGICQALSRIPLAVGLLLRSAGWLGLEAMNPESNTLLGF